MKIPLNEITVPEGRREIDWNKVAELAASIKIVGLINPLTVDEDNTLIAGAHRYEACKHLGFDEIECVVLDCDELRIELVEIDENFVRNDLDPISIGELAIRRDEILEALGLRKKPHGDGSNQHKSKGEIISPLRTTADIAKEVGVSERTLQHNKQLARDLTPEAKAVVRAKELPKTEALKIARLEPEKQRDFAEQLATGEVKDCKEYERNKAREAILAESKETHKQSPPKIVIGDGIEWLQEQTQCDLLLTDPPYSTDIDDIEAFANRWLPIALSKVVPTGCAYVFASLPESVGKFWFW